MRKLLTTTLLCFFIFCGITQNSPILESAELGELLISKESCPIVSGKLIGYSKVKYPELTIRYTISTLTFRKQISKTAQINTDGAFTLEFEQSVPYQEIYISIGELYFGKILAQNDLHLEVNIDLLSVTPVRFSGEGLSFVGSDAALNEYINRYEEFKIDKRDELIQEKLEILMDVNLTKSDKIEEIQKVYKKLAGIENTYAKKNGRDLEWILANDRIANMYADVLSVYWGSKMKQSQFQEVLSFSPKILSNATVQYYDFLGFYMTVPNRIETKMLVEQTLRSQLAASESMAHLDQFLREYEKKRNHLVYETEIYRKGEEIYLDRYEAELTEARFNLFFKKLKGVKPEKANIVCLLAQPVKLNERQQFLERLIKEGQASFVSALIKKDIEKDEELIEKVNLALSSFHLNIEESLGEPVDSSTYYYSNAPSIIQLLTNIKAQFPEKAIVINLWAPWSDLCIKDVNEATDFAKAIDSLPIQMVYLSSSNDVSVDYWKSEIKNLKLEGEHILLNQHLSAEIMEYFHVRSYPSYFYIDQDGKFDNEIITNLKDIRVNKLLPLEGLSLGI